MRSLAQSKHIHLSPALEGNFSSFFSLFLMTHSYIYFCKFAISLYSSGVSGSKHRQAVLPGKGRALRRPTQKWSCRPSDGQCCDCARVHVEGAGGWQRLSEDTRDTLVKDTVIAGPGNHNRLEEA